jgi:hypothetical protein
VKILKKALLTIIFCISVSSAFQYPLTAGEATDKESSQKTEIQQEPEADRPEKKKHSSPCKIPRGMGLPHAREERVFRGDEPITMSAISPAASAPREELTSMWPS